MLNLLLTGVYEYIYTGIYRGNVKPYIFWQNYISFDVAYMNNLGSINVIHTSCKSFIVSLPQHAPLFAHIYVGCAMTLNYPLTTLEDIKSVRPRNFVSSLYTMP